MKAVSTGKHKTTVEAPKGATVEQLEKKASTYIKGTFKIGQND